MSAAPRVSVVVPVYNEEAVLPALFARLYPALDALGQSYELIFVNDGSRDRSAALLRQQFEKRPEVTRVILFNGNFGQHMAIMAAFEQCRGDMIVTFLAMLEMIRLKLIRVFQAGGVGAIRIYKRARPADAPHPIHDPEDAYKRRHPAGNPEGLPPPVGDDAKEEETKE